MTDQNRPPADNQNQDQNQNDEEFVDNFIEAPTATAPPTIPEAPEPVSAAPANNAPSEDADMGQRLERLGGEPAPVITPEEFARLQKAGQVHIDERGRVRTARRTSDANAGVSLRKRRAWYVI